jgi:aspartate aminotransferase
MENHRFQTSLNLNVRGLGQSATIAINQKSLALIRQGHRIGTLGLGQSPFPVAQPVVDALKHHASEKDYLPTEGLETLREAVAMYHEKKNGVPIRPENVMIGPGSKELMFLLQLTYYGDLVIPTPSWVSYEPQARIVGRRVFKLHTSFADEWRLQPEKLEELCYDDPETPRIVIINYPGNPEGSTYTETELKELASVARKYNIILLSDEIYGELDHEGSHISIARYYPEGTIISSGLSKWCGAGGWRLGTFSFPPELHWLMEAIAGVASETFTSTSAPIQYAAITAFRGGIQIERYLAHSRRILKLLGNWCADRIAQTGADLVRPKGAFYLFPDFTPLKEKLNSKGITTSIQLADRALEEAKVAILPGTAFGRDPSEMTVRLAYVNFNGASALAGSESIPLHVPLDTSFLNTYCDQTLYAISRLSEWIEAM